MEPIQYLRIARRRIRFLAACVLAGLAAAWFTTPANPERAREFEASHTLIRQNDLDGPRQTMGTIALFVTTGEVPQRVAQRLGFEGNPTSLADQVTTEADEALGSLVITVRDGNGTFAAELSNAFAEETLAFLGEKAQVDQQLQVDALTTRLDELETRIAELDAEINQSSGSSAELLRAQRDAQIRQYGVVYEQFQGLASKGLPQPEVASLQPATPVPVTDGGFAAPSSRVVRLLMGALVALVLGAVLVLALERVDTRLRSKEQVEQVTGLPVIAEIPRLASSARAGHAIVSVTQPMSLAGEAYRILRASLLLMARRPSGAEKVAEQKRPVNGHDPDAEAGKEPQVILVTSPKPEEGKTSTVANLAAAFAETGRTVLVLNGDFRRPEVHNYFGVSEGPGLTDAVRGGPDAPALLELLRFTTVGGVALVTSGTRTESPIQLPAQRRKLIADARALADIVLIDTAPVLLTNDAVELSADVDAVVLVCRSGRTSAEDAARASELLTRVGADVTGVVLVGVSRGESPAYYYQYDEEQDSTSSRGGLGSRLRRWAMPGSSPAPTPSSRVPAAKAATVRTPNGERTKVRPRRSARLDQRLAGFDVTVAAEGTRGARGARGGAGEREPRPTGD